MKYLFYLVCCALFLASCDPELHHAYSVENSGTQSIQVRFSELSEPEFLEETINVTIEPGDTREITNYAGIGTTKDIESHSIRIEELEISNDDGEPYNKDPYENSLWEKTAIDKNHGEFLLKVADGDFN